MAEKEVDILGEAFRETEGEVFGDALSDAELDPRALEEMEDLSVKPEAEEAEGEDDGEAEPEPEGEPEGDEQERDERGRFKADDERAQEQQRQGAERQGREPRIPPARLREVNEAKRAAEAERDAAKAQLAEHSAKLDLALRQLNELSQRVAQPAQPAKEAEQPKPAPNLFEDPEGFVNHLQQGFKTELHQRDQRLAEMQLRTSLGLAHARHGADFIEADKAVGALNRADPNHVAVIQRIMASSDPGEAMVQWHREQRMLREIGPDPAAYQKRIRDEIAKDPKFREELLASLREEARNANNGRGNTVTRIPKSLNGAAGARTTQAVDPDLYDPSDASAMEYALK